MTDTENSNTKRVVIIPAYEPPSIFPSYAKELSATAVDAIIVVDDGSGEAFAERFAAVRAVPKCTVLVHGVNRGKGAALKTAFTYAKEHFPENTVFATADSDGQHTVRDVLAVLDAVENDPTGLTLGVRNFDSPDVPRRSRSGNAITSTLFRLVHGVRLDDTQTGLRGCAGTLLPWLLTVGGDRFEYEMNMLIDAAGDGVPLHTVPIATVYKVAEGRSHFRTFTDSVKVMRAVFGHVGFYILSSVLSALTDVVLFLILQKYVDIPAIIGCAVALHTPIAKATARVISSIVNVTMNAKYVFHGKGAACIVRYYILWAFQLAASSGAVTLLIDYCRWPSVLAVVLVDLTLALISYQIQLHWVFCKPKKER